MKGCNVPPVWQDAVIRSALALRLHFFEDTGAVVAATTTSIPEAPGSGRNWDYRYCWLRDAYYVLTAFRLLGQFEERERFTQWLLDVASGRPDLHLAPLYRVDGREDLEERIISGLGRVSPGAVRSGSGTGRRSTTSSTSTGRPPSPWPRCSRTIGSGTSRRRRRSTCSSA